MKTHPIPSANPFSHTTTRSSRPTLLATLAVTAAILTSQALAQTAPAPQTAQAAAAPTLALQPSISSSSSSVPSAPATPSQEARLMLPDANSRFNFIPALDNSQGSNLVSTPAKAPGHGLAKTGAIVGLVFVGLGAGAYALAAGHCSSYSSGPCSAFHTGGIVAMAGGGAAAGTGFYFWFHKPAQ
jgi:hypothetical protein